MQECDGSFKQHDRDIEDPSAGCRELSQQFVVTIRLFRARKRARKLTIRSVVLALAQGFVEARSSSIIFRA